MTVEEIKEWWNTAITHDKHTMIDVIDDLLAEVDQHHTKFNEWDKATNLLIKQLAVATEVLERITEYKDQGNERECPYIARTALERIKE